MVGQVASMIQNRTVYGIMAVKHEQKRPRVRPEHRQIGNVNGYPTNAPSPLKSPSDERTKKFK